MDGLDMLEEWLERIAPVEKSDEALSHRDFADEVRERMETGRRTYGDKSFQLAFSQLMAEAKQEAVDLAGWPYMAWRKLLDQRSRLATDDPIVPELDRAMECLEFIGWQASLTWSRMGRLVNEVDALDRVNNDHEQDGA